MLSAQSHNSSFCRYKKQRWTPTTNSRSSSAENQRERRKLLEHNQRQRNLKKERHHIATTRVFSEMHRPSANSYWGHFQLATLKVVSCLVESLKFLPQTKTAELLCQVLPWLWGFQDSILHGQVQMDFWVALCYRILGTPANCEA